MATTRISASVDPKLAKRFNTKVIERFYNGNVSAGVADGMRKMIVMADRGELVLRTSALPVADLKKG